jgi:hypothetical protein
MTPYATKTGIVIGSAWTPPPPAMSNDAIVIQSAMLAPQPERRSFRAEVAAFLVILAAAIAAVFYPA